jgi:hypothetical protein
MAGIHESPLIECALVLTKLFSEESAKRNYHQSLHSTTKFLVYFKVREKFELCFDCKDWVRRQAGRLLGKCSKQVDEAQNAINAIVFCQLREH